MVFVCLLKDSVSSEGAKLLYDEDNGGSRLGFDSPMFKGGGSGRNSRNLRLLCVL